MNPGEAISGVRKSVGDGEPIANSCEFVANESLLSILPWMTSQFLNHRKIVYELNSTELHVFSSLASFKKAD